MSDDSGREALPGLDALTVAGLIKDAVKVWSPLVSDEDRTDLARMWNALFSVASGLASVVQRRIGAIDNSPVWQENEAFDDPLLTRLSPVFGHLAGLNDVTEDTLLAVGGQLSHDLEVLGRFLTNRLEPQYISAGQVKESLDASFRIESQFQRYERVLQVRDAQDRASLLAGQPPAKAPSPSTNSKTPETTHANPGTPATAKTRTFGRLTGDGKTPVASHRPPRRSLWQSLALWSTKTAGSELTKHFDGFAASNALAARLYRGSSIVLTFLVLGAALWTYVSVQPNEPLEVIWRSSLLVGSIGLAAYLARQGAMHHELGTWAKTIAVQLSTFESYLASVEDEEAIAELRQRFAHRVFMSEPSPTRHPRAKVNLQSVIDGAGEALKNSRP